MATNKRFYNVYLLLFLLLPFYGIAQFPGCPSVDAGNNQTLDCTTSCINLTAAPFETGGTESYSVASIPFTPPIPFNQSGGTAVSVGTDDVYSPVINLPFSFCFYGQVYTTAKIGSNGAISLGSAAGTWHPWSFSASVPSSALSAAGNIFGPYHDIDPYYGGTVKYHIMGSAPCRILAVVFNDLPHFSCHSKKSTFMMVLYETTNVIDVYVQRKDSGCSWNSGNAVIGIQNHAGNTGITPPGRNTGVWSVSSGNPEAWRFKPSGAPIYTVDWLENGTVIGTGTTISVCPSTQTTYTARATYTPCGGGTPIVVEDQVTVTPDPLTPNISAPADVDICLGESVTLTANNPDNHVLTWSNGIVDGQPFTPNSPGSTTYTVSATAGTCTATDNVTVTVHDAPPVSAGQDQTICEGESITLSGSGAVSYSWNNGVVDGVPFTPSATATYTVTGTDAYGCENTDQVTVTINENPTATVSQNIEVCQWDNDPSVVFTGANGIAPYTFTYTVNGGAPQTVTSTGNEAEIFVQTNVDDVYTFELIQVEDAGGAGCFATLSEIVVVTVKPLPLATISGDITICKDDNEPIVLFEGSNGDAPYTFTYSLNGGSDQTILSTGNDAMISAPTNTEGTYTYELISVDDSGTNSCSNQLSSTVTITVNPLPTASISGDVIVCYGDTDPEVTFTGADGAAPYTFTYTINGGTQQTVTSTGNNATISIPTTAAGTFEIDLISIEEVDFPNCYNSQSGTVTVQVNPLPTATIIGDIEICQFDNEPEVTLTGNGGTAPYTFTYTLNGTTQTVTSTGDVAVISVPTTNSGTFTYELVSVEDASSTGCFNYQSGSIDVIINPAPSASISGDIDVCLGASEPPITFIGGNGTAPYTFTYTINGGNDQTVVSQGNSFVINAPTDVSGEFIYELNHVQDGSSTSCSNSQSQSVTVNVIDLPTANIQGSSTVCVGDEEPVITITGENGTSPYILTYSINGGQNQLVASTGDVATITAPTSTAGVFVYELTSVQESSSLFCYNTVVDTITITVNPLPTATIDGSITVCQDDDAPAITFEGSSATSPYTFYYTIDGGDTESVTSSGNTAVIYAPTNVPGTYTYELTGVEESSSTTCYNDQSGTVVIVVNPLPNALVSDDIEVCNHDDEPQIVFTGTTGESPYTFLYSINGNPQSPITSTGDQVSITVPTDVVGTFVYEILTIQDGSSTACVNESGETVTVVVHPNPTGTISGSTEVCRFDDEPVVTFTGINGTGDYIFTYNINGGSNQDILTNGSSTAYVYVPTANDTTFEYNLVHIEDAETGCYSNLSEQVVIVVHPLPVASFYPDPAELNSQVWTSQMVNNSEGATYYNWNFGDEMGSSTEESPIHSFPNTSSNSYTIVLEATSVHGCVDTTSAEVTFTEQLIFYIPNSFTPDNDDYNEVFKPIFTSGFDPQSYTLLIYNRWGEVVFESHNASVGWSGTYGENGDVVKSGTYIWKIEFKKVGTFQELQHYTGHVNLLR